MAKAADLTLLNPHADDFVSTPVSFWLVGRRGLCKYRYLLDEPIRRGRRISILVDGTLSALVDQRLFAWLPRWLRTAILRLEIRLWLRNNDLAEHVDVHWSVDTIKDRTTLFVFSYKNCVGEFGRRQTTISSFKLALINLSHYFIRTREKTENIAKLPNACIVADSDLRQNTYFQNFFPTSLPIMTLPFAVNDRFMPKRPFMERDAKCAASGSFHNLTNEKPHAYYRDFIEFFQTDTYHPIRKLLYQNRAQEPDWLTSRISPYREMTGNKKIGAQLRKLFRLDVVQAEYFSFDIVDFYNQHRFAIVGEEMSGAPAVGFFEAMACGNVMLGQRGSYYDGLDLEPNVHYLPHDGTLDSIRTAIEQANGDIGRTKQISEAGIAYVAAHCTPASVWNALEKNLAFVPNANRDDSEVAPPLPRAE